MQYGRFAVDYEYRPCNPDRMRKERVEKADNIGNYQPLLFRLCLGHLSTIAMFRNRGG